ncbi:hypothetical protein AB0N17_46305 [Streptomyces sp. NPDC051133]|uniref:hypothetical protein n=1 Tax=Streptomyces sp. NPDC051133 TaxID=3155521 RepID=UPI0034305AC2
MAIYYRAKAHRDLGQNQASRDGMRHVADRAGRLAPDAARGLAHLARAAGDFPTALATARTLGWPGRGHRVLGDIHFAHGDMDQAATHYTTARTQAEEQGNLGEQAIAQANLALTTAFTDPSRADGEIALAEQLLTGLDQRATTLTAQIAAIARDAGTLTNLEGAPVLRTEIHTAGITAARAALDLALAFHHAARDDDAALTTTIDHLNSPTGPGDYAYYADIARFMAGRPLPQPTITRWLDDEDAVRNRWRTLVTARHGHLRTGR